jgi:hypothetical protein
MEEEPAQFSLRALFIGVAVCTALFGLTKRHPELVLIISAVALLATLLIAPPDDKPTYVLVLASALFWLLFLLFIVLRGWPR